MNLTDEQKKARRKRNIALAVSLISFIVIIYLVTIFKLGAALFI